VSERERMYISEKYCNYVTGEVDKAIEVLQNWAQTYPNDFIPRNNLAVNYAFIGRYEEALREALEAARLDPNNINHSDNVVDAFIKLNRLDEASQKLEEVRARHLTPVRYILKHSFWRCFAAISRPCNGRSNGPPANSTSLTCSGCRQQ